MERIIFFLLILCLYYGTYSAEHEFKVFSSSEDFRAKRFIDQPHYIYGGQLTMPSEYPHLAAIGYKYRGQTVWRCGGALISKRFVLTAGHCLEDKTYHRYGKAHYVRLGDIDLKNPSDDANVQQISVARRIPHPDYKPPEKYNDIGLLELQDDVEFDRYVKPACLHKSHDIQQMKAEVVGWGETENRNREQKLRKVEIDLHGVEKCVDVVNRVDASVRDVVLRNGLIDDEVICAGVLEGGKDSCGGDSGGPLQVSSNSTDCSAEILGVVSFGVGECAERNKPAVYVRVSKYVPWIESVMNSQIIFEQ